MYGFKELVIYCIRQLFLLYELVNFQFNLSLNVRKVNEKLLVLKMNFFIFVMFSWSFFSVNMLYGVQVVYIIYIKIF